MQFPGWQGLLQAPVIARILAFGGIWLLVWLPVAIPLAIALKWRPFQPLAVAQKLPLVLSLYALAPPLLWGVVWLEGKSFATYGIQWDFTFARSLMIGLMAGAASIGILVGLQTGLGWMEWRAVQRSALVQAMPLTLLLSLGVSLVEELVFRGFLLNQLQGYGWVVAAIGSSVIFAVLHLVWDGIPALPQLPGLWLMGIVLVVARWADSDSLGIACGLHAGWVWALASLDTLQLTRYTGRGAAWITGIGGQPLAGGMSLLLLLITGATLGWFAVS